VFEAEKGTAPREFERLDFPKELSIHEFSGNGPHPLDVVQALIVGSAGPGFIGRMSARGVVVVTTSESDPVSAVTKYLAGNLPVAVDAAGAQTRSGGDEASEFLKAMANETRLAILCVLLQGEKSVSELEQQLGLNQSTVSQHLARLRRAGLVKCRHAGLSVYYSLANSQVSTIITAVYEAHCARAHKGWALLRTFVLFDVRANGTIDRCQELTPPPHVLGTFPAWLHEQGATVIIARGMGAPAQDLFSEQGIEVVTGASGEGPDLLVRQYLKRRLIMGANACDH
jgi:DNA-binding transcriptional ArsR family regulator